MYVRRNFDIKGLMSFTGTWSSVNYSATVDGTADDWGGTGNRPGQFFSFVDPEHFDYHLVSRFRLNFYWR
jgi:hypothetical protein